ncbi:MAG: hypothetical protein Q8O38_16570, partial [Sulfurimicrobium sp.]|nr:hypothetical protein [Sulfurimicrobium sp.]
DKDAGQARLHACLRHRLTAHITRRSSLRLATGQNLLRPAGGVFHAKATPPIPAIVPVSKSTWYAGIASGRFPKAVKIGNTRGTFWRAKDIAALIASV